jgi:hypothetical protein
MTENLPEKMTVLLRGACTELLGLKEGRSIRTYAKKKIREQPVR